MKNKRLPIFLQPFLWSVKIDELNLKEDRVYIIHQILAFGNFKAIRWLFQAYSLREIKKVFLKHSYRTYRNSAFNFAAKILLNINKPLNPKKYVANSF